MKKATVIIIAAIYVASIVVVGVFGLNALASYDDAKNILAFILPEEINGAKVMPMGRDYTYSVTFRYTEGLAVPITFDIHPADVKDRLAVQVELEAQSGSEDNPAAAYSGGILMFYRPGSATLRIKATDGGDAYVVLEVVAL